jgi:hypothetical protein
VITSIAGQPGNLAIPATPRRPKPPSRPLHEPVFVVAGPRSLDHVFDQVPGEPAPPRRRRWPLAVVLALVVAAGGGLLAIALRADRADDPTARAPVRDAAPADAAVVQIVIDAAPADAEVIADLPVDAGTRPHRDAGHATAGPVTVTVFTRPGEAYVFIDGHRRGPSGVHIQLTGGVKQKIECRIGNYEGTVIWDGVRDTIMCTALRKPMCVPDLHNPIDHCKDDGSADEGPVTKPM